MILDQVLTKFQESFNHLIQPTDNAFGGLAKFSEKYSEGVAKITEFTKQVIEESEKEEEVPKEETEPPKKKKKSEAEETEQPKKVSKKQTAEQKAEQKLVEKLTECYRFRDEVAAVANTPVSVIMRAAAREEIRTDTPPDLISTGLQLLLGTFNHFLETINSGDSRNVATKPKVEGAEPKHPHAAALQEAIAKAQPQPNVQTGNNTVRHAGPNKTVTKTLTRPK